MRHFIALALFTASCTTEPPATGTGGGDIGVTLPAIRGNVPAPDAPAPPPAKRKLVLLFGQSNAASRGLVSELADPSLADPYPAVPFTEQIGNNYNPPTVLTYPVGPLQPYPRLDGLDSFGVELSMGRALDAAEPGQWAIAKIGYGSTALAGEWWPTGQWPTGQPNLFTQQLAYVQQALADTGSDLAAMVWIQGESDAVTVALGQRYELGLAMFMGAEREKLPCDPRVPFIYGRLNINNPQVGRDAVRASQEANQNRYAILVDQDPYPLGPDLTHYTTQGVLDLGTLYAQTILAHEVQ